MIGTSLRQLAQAPIDRSQPMSTATLLAQALQAELLKRGMFTTDRECCEIMATVIERSGKIAERLVKVIETVTAERRGG
jgi:hypothetical protein